MRKILMLLVVTALVFGCSKTSVPTQDSEFKWFLTGTATFKETGKPASNVSIRVTDNNTNQSEIQTTNSDGTWKELRWKSQPLSLKGLWYGVPPQQVVPDHEDSVQFTCVDHPEDHAAKLCRFAIEVTYDSGL